MCLNCQVYCFFEEWYFISTKNKTSIRMPICCFCRIIVVCYFLVLSGFCIDADSKTSLVCIVNSITVGAESVNTRDEVALALCVSHGYHTQCVQR